jgi:hypothetical protein
MRLEERLIQTVRPLEYYESTVVWSVWSKVDNALSAMKALMVRILVHMWPWRGRNPLAFWQWECVIDAVERYEQFVGVPELLKCIDDTWLTACVSYTSMRTENRTYSLASQTNSSCDTLYP